MGLSSGCGGCVDIVIFVMRLFDLIQFYYSLWGCSLTMFRMFAFALLIYY